MIHAEIKLRVPRSHCVVILPNMTAAGGPIDGLDNLMDVQSYRPIEALHVKDIIEDCELVDKSTGDRINFAAGQAWQVRQLEVEPLAADAPMRVYTLVRVR